MFKGLEEGLKKLKDSSAQITANNAYVSENGCASIVILFSEGTRLRAEYWRLIKDGKAYISSFDHNQLYGLKSPIDAIRSLSEELHGRIVTEVHHESETGDIILNFSNFVAVQIFNFTGYEIWEITFPDGTGEYSNYAK